jgi:hypothetical protein
VPELEIVLDRQVSSVMQIFSFLSVTGMISIQLLNEFNKNIGDVRNNKKPVFQKL